MVAAYVCLFEVTWNKPGLFLRADGSVIRWIINGIILLLVNREGRVVAAE